jgi:hypothetical protein
MSEREPLMSSELQDRIVATLRRHHREGAMWTADIAHALKEKTPAVRAALLRLEADKTVQRVVEGNPVSWALMAPTRVASARVADESDAGKAK